MVDAGWYPDPATSGTVRWWDGQQWTEHTMAATQSARVSLFAEPEVPAAPVPDTMTHDTVFFDAPTYVAPGSPTTAYGAADFASPTPAPGPSYVAPLTSYVPAPAASAAKPRSSGVLAALIVGAVFLAVAGIGIGFAVTRSATSPGAGGTIRSEAPTPTTTPESPGPSSAPPSSPGPSSSATGLGAALEGLKPGEADLPAGLSMSLIADGDKVAGQRTLDGWCSMTYASERARIERRQWDLVQGTQRTGVSIEVVAYATPEDAAAALAEFRKYTRACTGVTLSIDGTSITQKVTASKALAPAEGVTGFQGIATWTVPQATGGQATLHSVATVQRSGQFLSIVWVTQTTAFTPDDLSAIGQFVDQQTRALTSTVNG